MRPTDRKYLKSHEWCKIEGETIAEDGTGGWLF